jgi:hypothetical protein
MTSPHTCQHKARKPIQCPVCEIAWLSPLVSWLFFKARPAGNASRSTAHIVTRSVSGGVTSISKLICKERATRKNSQLTSGPEGCDENGPATALLAGYVSIQLCALLPPVRLGPPCRRPILIATKAMLFPGQDTTRKAGKWPLGGVRRSRRVHRASIFRMRSATVSIQTAVNAVSTAGSTTPPPTSPCCRNHARTPRSGKKKPLF